MLILLLLIVVVVLLLRRGSWRLAADEAGSKAVRILVFVLFMPLLALLLS